MALRSISNLPIQIILGFCRMDFIPTFPNRDQAMFPARPLKLLDCAFQPEGVAAELMIVEGDSASSSVGAARDERFQAVLPLQGKPLNAWKASRTRVAANPFYQAIIDAIGAGWDESFAIERVRYERIVLIFDPDADGIHCSMLVLMFFYRWMRPLLDSGRIYLIHPPMFELTAPGLSEIVCAANEEAADSQAKRLKDAGFPNVTRKRFRGLGSMGHAILSTYCVRPETRLAVRMKVSDATAAIAAFSPKHIP
jgi:DNA gyrase/topoisomerase IV subunit B